MWHIRSDADVQIDESHTVGEIVRSLCSKLGIENPETYALYMESVARNNQTDTTWLQAGATLRDQNVADDAVIGFNRAPAAEIVIDPNDIENIEALFAQA